MYPKFSESESRNHRSYSHYTMPVTTLHPPSSFLSRSSECNLSVIDPWFVRELESEATASIFSLYHTCANITLANPTHCKRAPCKPRGSIGPLKGAPLQPPAESLWGSPRGWGLVPCPLASPAAFNKFSVYKGITCITSYHIVSDCV